VKKKPARHAPRNGSLTMYGEFMSFVQEIYPSEERRDYL
jgi:hypothetical protein